MNTYPGLIGRKLGNTQFFNEQGELLRATVIQSGPCVVLRKRTMETDGYSALQIGFGTKRAKNATKADIGALKGLEEAYPEGTVPESIRELRLPVEEVAKYEAGQRIAMSEVFQVGQFVDVSGNSKGRGFTGVMKRHNFSGCATETHGTHEYFRHGGSIGQRKTPGRTFRNMKMPGQYGNERVTIMNLKVAALVEDDNLLLVEGAVPGPKQGLVTVRRAVKKTKAVA